MRALLIALLVAGCAPTPQMSDWEREHSQKNAVEEAVVMPPFPRGAKLIEFPMADAGGFRFFIDGGTLSVGKDGVVRYTLVAQSPSGVRNVTYEGLRCQSAEQRLYATGRADSTWVPSRTGWQSMQNARPWQRALYREYFCPQKLPIRDADEGVRALQAGGHPFSKGFSPNLGL